MCLKHYDKEFKICKKCANEIRAEKNRTEPITERSFQDKQPNGDQNKFPLVFSKDQLVAGKYRIIDIVNRISGEAYVYLCEDIARGDKAVLKLYHQGFSASEEIVKLFVGVTNKDVLNILDYGKVNGQFFEVMEYAEGGTLLDRLKEKSFSETELSRHVIPAVLHGLAYCHKNEIIHRDIKPGNLFYRDKARRDIVLGDFGISTLLDQDVTVRKTKGALTIDFAAPELFGWKGEHYVSKKTDYYSLGITLVYLFLGQSPFYGLSALQIMTKHISERLLPPDDLSDRFKKLLSGLLIKERKRRWGAPEIERWLNSDDVPVHEDDHLG